MKVALARYWYQRLPESIGIAQETTLRMDKDTFVEPDFVLFRSDDGLEKLSAETALLAVEVAESSLDYDRGRKARLYAAYGL